VDCVKLQTDRSPSTRSETACADFKRDLQIFIGHPPRLNPKVNEYTNMQKSNPNYRVGYRRPPTEHQFRPGQSGNPSGRPKGARSFASDLRDELRELVSISDDSKTVEVTKQRAIIKTLLRLAIAGDARAIATIVGTCGRRPGELDADDEPEAPEDDAIMEAVAAYPSKGRKKMSSDTPPRGKETP